jgi:hypothetical protein
VFNGPIVHSCDSTSMNMGYCGGTLTDDRNVATWTKTGPSVIFGTINSV